MTLPQILATCHITPLFYHFLCICQSLLDDHYLTIVLHSRFPCAPVFFYLDWQKVVSEQVVAGNLTILTSFVTETETWATRRFTADWNFLGMIPYFCTIHVARGGFLFVIHSLQFSYRWAYQHRRHKGSCTMGFTAYSGLV
jgi:hypothetical protein